MASSDEYDSDLDRVLDILDASSGSEFSGFESDDIPSSSDEDDIRNGNDGRDWRANNRNHRNINNGGDDVPRCPLRAGPKLPADFHVDTAGALDYFSLFVPKDFYKKIADETNSYAVLCQRENGEIDKGWSETSGGEIRTYLGLNVLMGASPRHQYEDYWKDDDFLGCTGFKLVMSRDRYAKLTQYLHVNSDITWSCHGWKFLLQKESVSPRGLVTDSCGKQPCAAFTNASGVQALSCGRCAQRNCDWVSSM